jgi:hypothetical protein
LHKKSVQPVRQTYLTHVESAINYPLRSVRRIWNKTIVAKAKDINKQKIVLDVLACAALIPQGHCGPQVWVVATRPSADTWGMKQHFCDGPGFGGGTGDGVV